MFAFLVDSSYPREKPQTLARRSKEQEELKGGGIEEDVIPLVRDNTTEVNVWLRASPKCFREAVEDSVP
jgi:hypothetical protein